MAVRRLRRGGSPAVSDMGSVRLVDDRPVTIRGTSPAVRRWNPTVRQKEKQEGQSMASHMPPPRISDLPREERLDALYRRAADDRARYMAMRARRPGFLDRFLQLF